MIVPNEPKNMHRDMSDREGTSSTRWNKVAEVTALFWVMKVIATTLGETLGDQLSMTLGLGYEVGIAITLGLFVVLLLWQLQARQYSPLRYWAVIVGTTTLGTEISDSLDRTFHLGYVWGSIVLASGLAVTLLGWYRRYQHLQVYPISERGHEVFYWVAVLFSNSLGTAFGDFLSDDVGLSYGVAACITGGIILLVVMLHYFTRLNAVLLFWVAFVFTRPFGATFGDLLTKPLGKGGLALGTLPATLVAAGLLAVLVYLSQRSHRKTPEWSKT